MLLSLSNEGELIVFSSNEPFHSPKWLTLSLPVMTKTELLFKISIPSQVNKYWEFRKISNKVDYYLSHYKFSKLKL